MPSLLRINISQNNLTGVLLEQCLQALPSLCCISQARWQLPSETRVALSMRPVCYAGLLPDQWANLAGLSTLDLQRNKLGGKADMPGNALPCRDIRLTPPAMLICCAPPDILLTRSSGCEPVC